MKISEMVEQAYKNADKKGFFIAYNNSDDELMKTHFISSQLMLIVSEVVEAVNALRYEDMENFAEELADILQRVASLCGLLQIDLEGEIEKKMEKNKARGYMHGKRL